MPIPALTADGYLPVGEFDCELVEVDAVFGITEHRQALLAKFREFLLWLRDEHGLELPYYVDGSYTTSKQVPSDIDFIIDISDAADNEIGTVLNLFTFQQAHIKEIFKVDFWFFHPDAQRDLRRFFQYVRTEELQQRQLPPETRKGILRLAP